MAVTVVVDALAAYKVLVAGDALAPKTRAATTAIENILPMTITSRFDGEVIRHVALQYIYIQFRCLHMGIEARSLSVSVGSDGTKRKHEARAIKRHSRDMEFDVRDQRCKSLQRMTRDVGGLMNRWRVSQRTSNEASFIFRTVRLSIKIDQ